MNDLSGQVAFVTGGSSGIGKACALRLARLGLKVAVCARRKEKLDRALEELRAVSPDVRGYELDVSDGARVRDCVREIEEDLGPIDILLNNAGTYRFGPVADFSPADWDRLFAVNFKAPFLVTQAVVPSMMARRTGRIVFVSSTITLISPEMNACYTACKRGLEAFAQSVAQELCEHNINVHVLRPGFTDTDAYEEIGGKPDWDIDWIAPDEIADAVEFLCRLPKHAQVPDLSYMTTFQRRSH